jgi:hypothetical protein
MSTDSDRASTGEPARQEHQLRHATLGTSGVAFFVTHYQVAEQRDRPDRPTVATTTIAALKIRRWLG